jgi:hypothetical protein
MRDFFGKSLLLPNLDLPEEQAGLIASIGFP